MDRRPDQTNGGHLRLPEVILASGIQLLAGIEGYKGTSTWSFLSLFFLCMTVCVCELVGCSG